MLTKVTMVIICYYTNHNIVPLKLVCYVKRPKKNDIWAGTEWEETDNSFYKYINPILSGSHPYDLI